MLLAKWKLRFAVHASVREAFRKLGYMPDIHHPVTFNEKVLRRCFQPVAPIMTRTSDKLEAKFWLREVKQADPALTGLEVVPLLWHGRGGIPWGQLAYPCVLKANHSWNMYRILPSQPDSGEAADIEAAAARWLKYEFGHPTHELQYTTIKRSLLIEALVHDNTDYKCFVFGGKVEFVIVATDRGRSTRSLSLDSAGKVLPFQRGSNGTLDVTAFSLPPQYSRMIGLAEALTKHLGEIGKEFVRLDFYVCDGVVYLGEVTWTPGVGRLPFSPPEWDHHYGSKFRQSLEPLAL